MTITTGNLYQKIAELTHPRIRAYANKCDADFIVWDDIGAHTSPGYRKIDIRNLLNTYDRVLYVDTDILIREDAPDLFEIVPETHIAALNEGQFCPRREAKFAYIQDPAFYQNDNYYNTGVMLMSKCHQKVFDPVFHEIDNFYEQTYLNWKFHQLKMPMFNLSYKFNRIFPITKMTGEDPLDCYFLHYAGGFSKAACDTPGLIETNLDAIVEHDRIWKTGQTTFLRNIYCQVSGGIGDCIAAEPVVRYILDNFYSQDNFVLQSSWPEVFTHLKHHPSKVSVGPIKPIPDIGYFSINLMPDGPYVGISHGATHPTDFASLKAFCGQIPPSAKRIVLHHDILNGYENAVVVHAGKGWPGKTFPVWYWQKIVDAIDDAGYTVVLVGQEMNEWQGYVNVETPPSGIDLRGKLTFQGLVNLIASAPVLLTNDSAPVHIAGAFNNYIGLINVCKPGYLILPFRYGSQEYRVALFENLMPFNFDPARVEPLRYDSFTHEQVEKHLPDHTEVVNWVKEVLSDESG